jgi:aminocarboxymuconate-semialdehyde decarboxylase
MAIGVAPGSRPLTDPELDPVWAALADADLGLFVHPDGDPLGAAKSGARPSVLGFPTVTTAVLLDLLAADCGLWSSGVRLCAAHGGGFVAAAHSRATRLLDPESRAAQQRRLDAIWVDGVVFDPRLFTFLTETFPTGRVLLGSDWPFPLSLSGAELFAQAQASATDPFQAATAWCPRLARLA